MDGMFKKCMGVKNLTVLPSRGGGLINDASSFQTEKGTFFIKVNAKKKARIMFEGERAGLEAIRVTDTVRCPRPIEIQNHPDGPGSMFVMEHLGLDLRDLGQHAPALGEQVARLHLHNSHLKTREESESSRIGHCAADGDEDLVVPSSVGQFGFHTTTCCGFLPLDNTWSDDWVTFFARQRLKPQLDLVERDYGDRDLVELWPRLVRVIPRLFDGLGHFFPSLLHGDLHGMNVAETEEGPVIYDPASFYGHHEYELAITKILVDFNQDFFPSYHRLIPKDPGFDQRQMIYQIFFYLNHWNHFGPRYREVVKSLINSLTTC